MAVLVNCACRKRRHCSLSSEHIQNIGIKDTSIIYFISSSGTQNNAQFPLSEHQCKPVWCALWLFISPYNVLWERVRILFALSICDVLPRHLVVWFTPIVHNTPDRSPSTHTNTRQNKHTHDNSVSPHENERESNTVVSCFKQIKSCENG